MANWWDQYPDAGPEAAPPQQAEREGNWWDQYPDAEPAYRLPQEEFYRRENELAKQPLPPTEEEFRKAYQRDPTTDSEMMKYRYKGKPEDFNPFEQAPKEPEAEGTIGTALRSAAHAVLPSAAGLAGIPAGIAAGAALGLPAGGWGAIPGGIVGGIGGYFAGSKAQETALKAMGFDDSQQMAVNTRMNPKSALAGEVLGALPTVGVGAGAQLVTRTAGAIGGAALETSSQLMGGEELDPTRIGGAALAGGLLTKPTRLGEAIGGGAARAIGRPELWHGTAGSKGAAGTAEEQPPPPATGEPQPVNTDANAKQAPQVFEGETTPATAQAPEPRVTPIEPDPAVAQAIRGEPIAPRVTEGEAAPVAERGPPPQVTEEPTQYGQMLDKEFPRVPQPQVIEGEAPAAMARGPEPRVTPVEEPVMENLARTPREAMAQKAPEENYGQVLRRLASDERGGGRVGGPEKPIEEPAAGPVAKATEEVIPTARLPGGIQHNPLDMARSGELSADRAEELAKHYQNRDKEIVDAVLGKEADAWRRAHKLSDQYWDSGFNDTKARVQDKLVEAIEAKHPPEAIEEMHRKLEQEEHTDPQGWRDFARDLRDVEGRREDAVTTVGYTLRRLPQAGKALSQVDRETLALIQHALDQEGKRGGEPEPFLREAFAKSSERYGGGADAAEIVADDMARLKELLKNPPQERPALPAPAAEAMPTPGVIEGKTIPGAKGKADAALQARGFTPEQIAGMKPKDKTAILQKREGEIGSGPKGDAMLRREAEVRAAPADMLTPTGGGKPPTKPPTVGQAAAAAGGTPPPSGPSMAYVPPSKRSDMSELWRSMKLLVGGDIGPMGRQAEASIRKSYGNLNREFEQGQSLLDRHRETIANTSEPDRWKLINRIEGGKQYAGWQPTPEQRTLINDHKSVMDAWKNQLQGLDRTKQMKFADDYLAHMYENPDQAKQFFNNWGKRGGAGSTKARTFPTYQDALDAGLKPLTSDPIELAQRYGLSMKHFIASNDVIERAVNTGVAGYFKAGKSIGASGSPSPVQVGGPPPGWKQLNAPPNKLGHELYAPEDFADKYNKFYERGYFGGAHAPIYNAIRQSNSAWTQLELGLNAYHFFTMANEAVISDVARGFDKVFSGQFKKGLQDIAQSPLAPRTRYVEGKRFQQEYLNPNSTNPVASVLAEVNARPIGKGHALDVLGTPGDPTVPVRGAFIKNFSPDNINFEFRKAWDEVKQDWGASQGLSEVVKFPFKQASRAIQTVSAPLFDKYIPALKAGAVHSQMEAWFEANPHIDPHNMTPEQRASAVAAATKIVDSIDNRFGEMIHDNLFMNKTLQQSAVVGMRSFSWTLGAMREIAGGTAAGAKAFSALGRGENKFSMAHPEYDPRIAYTLALPTVVAMTSAIYQYLKTGELPQDASDLYAPKTGGIIPGLGGKGEVQEHVLMPGFHKDVYGWLAHPLREAYAKGSGAVTTAYEQLTNEDWRGDPIYKRGADPIEHMQQRASHLFSRMGPISVKAMIKGQPETSGISPIETSLGFRAPGAEIQDPKQLENWMRVKSEREWEAKQRHGRTEAKKYEPRAMVQ